MPSLDNILEFCALFDEITEPQKRMLKFMLRADFSKLEERVLSHMPRPHGKSVVNDMLIAMDVGRGPDKTAAILAKKRGPTLVIIDDISEMFCANQRDAMSKWQEAHNEAFVQGIFHGNSMLEVMCKEDADGHTEVTATNVEEPFRYIEEYYFNGMTLTGRYAIDYKGHPDQMVPDRTYMGHVENFRLVESPSLVQTEAEPTAKNGQKASKKTAKAKAPLAFYQGKRRF